jgi:aspartyl protease family protein
MPDIWSEGPRPRGPWDRGPAPAVPRSRFAVRLAVIAGTAAGLLLLILPTLPPAQFDAIGEARMVQLVVIGGAALCALAASRVSLASLARQAAAWVAIALVAIVGYSFRGELLPHRGVPSADGSLSFAASSDRHFWIEASVDGTRILFLVDTGATTVALSREDARTLGFNLRKLDYAQPIYTANGMARAAPVHLAAIRVGTIEVRNVAAFVAEGDLPHSLLGMNFLERLGGVEIKGDRLTIR